MVVDTSFSLTTILYSSVHKRINKYILSTSTTSSKSFAMANLLSNINMNIDINIIRGRFASSSKLNLREFSILSNTSSSLYYERMEGNNNLLDKDIWNPIDSSQLSYEENVEVDKSVIMTTDKHSQGGSQCVSNKVLVLKNILKL